MRMWGLSGMRSFDASVSIRLSSMTLFMDSIQFASRSPSSMIHFGSSSGIAPMFRMTVDSKPSFHSRVAMLMYPYNSCVSTAFGFTSQMPVLSSGPISSRAFAKIRQHSLLPAAAGPMRKTQCLISSSSFIWTHFKQNASSGSRLSSSQALTTLASKVSSLALGGLRPGNRSPNSPKNTTSSSLTILGMFESRKARSNTEPSGRSGSARFIAPAITKTLFTALNPQS
mmetsp:Transcript_10255/g.30177  ORF Transcript_10255/g.30177 Transcript_10255/m.30177 type:complete len:227 (-) Transcript_10255:5041-5721(-)